MIIQRVIHCKPTMIIVIMEHISNIISQVAKQCICAWDATQVVVVLAMPTFRTQKVRLLLIRRMVQLQLLRTHIALHHNLQAIQRTRHLNLQFNHRCDRRCSLLHSPLFSPLFNLQRFHQTPQISRRRNRRCILRESLLLSLPFNPQHFHLILQVCLRCAPRYNPRVFLQCNRQYGPRPSPHRNLQVLQVSHHNSRAVSHPLLRVNLLPDHFRVLQRNQAGSHLHNQAYCLLNSPHHNLRDNPVLNHRCSQALNL